MFTNLALGHLVAAYTYTHPWHLVPHIRPPLLHLLAAPNATLSDLHEDSIGSQELQGTADEIVVTFDASWSFQCLIIFFDETWMR